MCVAQAEGWYPLGWTDSVQAGAARPLVLQGQPVALFRTQSGAVRVVSAFCPHLGAHLGVGGTVVGESVRCPFHGWEFGGDGVCTNIPYTDRIPSRARVGAWRAVARDGLVWVRLGAGHAHGDSPPSLEGLSGQAWAAPLQQSHLFVARVRPEVLSIHHHTGPAIEVDAIDALLAERVAAQALGDAVRSVGGHAEITSSPGVLVGRTTTPRGARAAVLVAVTPVDAHRVVVHSGVYTEPGVRGWLDWGLRRRLARVLSEALAAARPQQGARLAAR